MNGDEAAPCIMCGFGHRYQWPSGSDVDGHAGSYVACINVLRPELARALAEVERLRVALSEAKRIFEWVQHMSVDRDFEAYEVKQEAEDWLHEHGQRKDTDERG